MHYQYLHTVLGSVEHLRREEAGDLAKPGRIGRQFVPEWRTLAAR
jgi:hypothetical protein